MVHRTATFTAAALLALAAVSTADITNLEYAEWSSRGSDDDLFRFVTVRANYVHKVCAHNSADCFE